MSQPVAQPQLVPVAAEPAICLKQVCMAFGTQQVLRGVDLELPRGAITVVIGMSGAGKSVLSKLMMGLLRPGSGTIEVGGTDITRLGKGALRKVRGRFGMVFQHGALFDSINVFENVAFPLREHTKMSERQIREAVLPVLDAVGLVDFVAKMPGELSGGMRKRASLARALVRKPEFLIYDEPTTGLDPIRTASIDRLIADTQERHPNLTSFVISHDMEATFRIADKIAMLYEGRIIAEGSPDAFRTSTDPRVQQFVAGELLGPIEP